MSGSRLIFAFGLVVIFSQISIILSADIVPVVLLGDKKSASTQSVDALRIMSEGEFREVVWKIVGGSRPAIAVFKKDDLCVEELGQEKLSFDHSDSTYFPSVNSPLSVFEDLESYNVTTDEKPETISDAQLIIIPVETIAAIPEIYKNLRKENPKSIGVITGTSCRYSRSERTRRAVQTRNDDAVEIIAQADRILFYSGEGIYVKNSGDSTFTSLGEVTGNSSVSTESNSVRLDLDFTPSNSSAVTLRLQFNATETKYWYLTSLEYEVNSIVSTLTSNTSIYFPFNFSYHCTLDTIFYDNNTLLNITILQVQVDPSSYTSDSTGYTLIFSDGWDCIGFTSIPILSGIFVTAFLALIMIWALTMVMDIRTMDRFDDPKGKTITVAASE